MQTVMDTLPFDNLVEASLTSGSTSQVNLTLGQDADFELHAILAHSSSDAETDVRPNNFSVQIILETLGMNLSNGRIQQAMLAPGPTGGYKLPRPVIIPANTTIRFDFKDEAAATHTARVVLRGMKIRKGSRL